MCQWQRLTSPLSRQLMATFQAIKKAVTLSPSVRTLPTGIPYAPLLNTAVRSPHDPHSHSTGPRSDSPPRWAARTSTLVTKTFTTGQFCFLPPSLFQLLISAFRS